MNMPETIWADTDGLDYWWFPHEELAGDFGSNAEIKYRRDDLYEALQAKCERYERALKFYAVSSNHTDRPASKLHPPMKDDLGERAREALNHKESQ